MRAPDTVGNTGRGESRIGAVPSVNPFSTRFVQPGAIPYAMLDGASLQELVRHLEQTAGWGQIIGPHGSGKSTLLASLIPELGAWQVRLIPLSEQKRHLPDQAWEPFPPHTLLVVDGFEQLGFWTRRRLQHHCRDQTSGLLVTAHRSLGLPTLARTDVPAKMAGAIIRGLVPPGGEWVLEGYEVAARLRANRGSLRDVLFELYDRWAAGSKR